jgi:tRNA-specific 2-thiouridylase
VLTAEQLAHAVFPLGETPSKALVRAEAAERGFRVATKPDSHDICFIPDGDTRGWLADRIDGAPGPVLDTTGAEVGRHEGAHAYTVGQRRGLSLTRPAPDGRPRFVLEVKPATNTVVVGPKEALAVGALAGSRISWTGPQPDGDAFRCDVQVRAHADPVPATAGFEGTELVVRPDEPVLGLAPGQSAVLYAGTRVLGQLTVDRTVAATPVA